jgi:hypothetical protein
MISLYRLKSILNEKPFHPLRVTMSSGDTYDIFIGEMAFMTKLEIVVALDLEDGVPTEFKTCSLRQVASVQRLVCTKN